MNARSPRPTVRFVLVALALVLAAPAARAGYTVPDGFVDEPVVGGLNQPVNLSFLPDGRCFVIERLTGRVRLVVDGAFSPIDPVLTVDSLRIDDGERGLLGIAVDPAWPGRPYVYVYYSHTNGPWIRIARFRASGDLDFSAGGQVTFDPASRYDVVSHIPDVSGVHNGGSLRFGPDGMLYAAIGDDNAACDALALDVLRGKIVRLDVSGLPDGPGGNPPAALLTPPDNPFVAHPGVNARLVWAWGLRNPYGFAIDRLTGALLIGDVGAANYEEIDHAPVGGLNFQWPVYEGPRRTPVICANVDSTAWTPPVHWYGRAVGQTVIAGFVYRRPPGAAAGFPLDHEGSFFFTDFYTGFIRRLVPGPGHEWEFAPAVPGQPSPTDWGSGRIWVSAFAQAPDGSVYYIQNWTAYPQPDGQVRRIRRAFVTDAGAAGRVGDGLRVGPAVPNPAPGPVRLTVELARPGLLEVTVHDVQGRALRRLRAGQGLEAGLHAVEWDGRDERGRALPAGVYLVRLAVPGAVRHVRIVRLGAGGTASRIRP